MSSPLKPTACVYKSPHDVSLLLNNIHRLHSSLQLSKHQRITAHLHHHAGIIGRDFFPGSSHTNEGNSAPNFSPRSPLGPVEVNLRLIQAREAEKTAQENKAAQGSGASLTTAAKQTSTTHATVSAPRKVQRVKRTYAENLLICTRLLQKKLSGPSGAADRKAAGEEYAAARADEGE